MVTAVWPAVGPEFGSTVAMEGGGAVVSLSLELHARSSVATGKATSQMTRCRMSAPFGVAHFSTAPAGALEGLGRMAPWPVARILDTGSPARGFFVGWHFGLPVSHHNRS